jgi:hypothetical protein
MAAIIWCARVRRAWLSVGVGLLAAALGAAPTFADATLTKISSDPFTNATSQHATQVEPGTFSFGDTIVAAFQSGRFSDGGSSGIGFATSRDGGGTWRNGFLPGITAFGGGPFARVSDPSVAFDARHGVWLISSLPLVETSQPIGAGIVVSRSLDGGLSWDRPVAVSADTGADKGWTVCDNTSTSPFYGRCYLQWDNNAAGDLIHMSTSTDGGLTWGPPQTTFSGEVGIGGQPVVQPNGTVVVPIDSANEAEIGALRSTDGGASWTDVWVIARIHAHTEAGDLRSGPLPSAEIDAAGRIYVVWSDCRFRLACEANDIVMSTSYDGIGWSRPARVPIDNVRSGVDHFIPGLGVDRSTWGAGAHLGLAYYFYPASRCSPATCQLEVGFISSSNGGVTWHAPTVLAGPMNVAWLASTTQGFMVGDYISTSFSRGAAHSVFAAARPPRGSTLDEAMYASTVSMG